MTADQGPLFYTYLSPSVQGWLEDGAKLLGIFGWCGYLARVAFGQIRPALHRAEVVGTGKRYS